MAEKMKNRPTTDRPAAGAPDRDRDCPALLLENQICFPLYVCAKEIVSAYTPYLKKLDLTYTQYITMMVMWEEKQIITRHLGERLYLDSGTLTPVLKRLEEKGCITRERSKEDARDLVVTITEAGERLKEEAVRIPEQMKFCAGSPEHADELRSILCEMMAHFRENKKNKHQ